MKTKRLVLILVAIFATSVNVSAQFQLGKTMSEVRLWLKNNGEKEGVHWDVGKKPVDKGGESFIVRYMSGAGEQIVFDEKTYRCYEDILLVKNQSTLEIMFNAYCEKYSETRISIDLSYDNNHVLIYVDEKGRTVRCRMNNAPDKGIYSLHFTFVEEEKKVVASTSTSSQNFVGRSKSEVKQRIESQYKGFQIRVNDYKDGESIWDWHRNGDYSVGGRVGFDGKGICIYEWYEFDKNHSAAKAKYDEILKTASRLQKGGFEEDMWSKFCYFQDKNENIFCVTLHYIVAESEKSRVTVSALSPFEKENGVSSHMTPLEELFPGGYKVKK